MRPWVDVLELGDADAPAEGRGGELGMAEDLLDVADISRHRRRTRSPLQRFHPRLLALPLPHRSPDLEALPTPA
jgi:hypothetical protein